MINVGIECESIEDGQSWGVGRIVNKLLQEIDRRPELKKEFRFFLYFKSKIPDYPYLKNDIFVKKIIFPQWLPRSFSFYYYVFLPIRLWFARLRVMYFPANMLPIIFSGKSMVTLTEDMHYEMYHGSLPFRYRLAYLVFGNWAAKRATKIIAVSQASKKEVARVFKIDPKRIAPIPNGVEINPHPEQRAKRENYIFYLGQAFPRRHLRETILAFEKIHPQFPDLKFYAVGKDAYHPPVIADLIKAVNARIGHELIIHKDYVSQDQLEALYVGAQAVVYVSSSEAFGLPPLEALGYGSVPVVSRLPASQEIFGDNAFYVDNPDSVDSIAATITEALTNPSKRADIRQAAPTILSRYTWQKHTDAFLDVIRNITHA